MKSRKRIAVMAVAGAGLLLLGSVSRYAPTRAAPPAPEAVSLPPIYAAPAERMETLVMHRGQTLGEMLSGTDFSGGSEMANFLLALREYMNPRRLMPGLEVTLHRSTGDGATRSVDVQLNPDTMVHLARGRLGWQGELRLTPVKRDTVFVAGQIDQGRTLFEALVEDEQLDVPPSERYALVVELARIYAYQIDFAHEIQPGDSYAFEYERDVRPDGSTRWRRVLAAVVRNRGRELPAILYEAGDEPADYYDLDGRSLKLQFSRYPLDYVRVTSSFSWRRYHPILGRYRAHLGTDFGANRGTHVKATGAGTVIFAGRSGGYGNLIKIRHPGGYETRYGHLNGFAPGIHAGSKVTQGQLIAYVGMTGLATAPHLHYEFRKDGKPLDPRGARLPAGVPVPRSQKPAFERVAAERLDALRARVGDRAQLAVLVRQDHASAGAASP